MMRRKKDHQAKATLTAETISDQALDQVTGGAVPAQSSSSTGQMSLASHSAEVSDDSIDVETMKLKRGIDRR